MQVTLDTNNPGDLELVKLIATVIAAEGRQGGGTADVEEEEPTKEEPTAPPAEVEEEPAEEPAAAEPETEESEEEVDADGVAWDPELHASTKTKTQDGRWKKRRNVRKEEPVKEVEEPVKEETTAPVVETKESDYINALTDHRGKFGIDRTRQIINEATGKEHPRDVDKTDWATCIAALEGDNGPDNNFDLEDF